MEMKEVLDREGRDAKNLLVYQFCEEQVANSVTNDKPEYRKPPVAPPKSPNSLNVMHTPKKSRSPARLSASSKNSSGPRVRSASTGRDKRSELQARYWALLFGNLQRAVNEIYQTCECYENISSCQEAILVLENYVRDFKALSEWFKVSWEYDSRPLQQRPQSLAWEVRKSNPGPRVRAKSLSSPSPNSGKSSPCHCNFNSGKSSPCCGNLDALSPRKTVRPSDILSKGGAMRVSVRELFSSNKQKQQQQVGNLSENSAEEKCCVINSDQTVDTSSRRTGEAAEEKQSATDVAKEQSNRRHQYAQTDLEDDHLTLADVREKMYREELERLEAEKALLIIESEHNTELGENVVENVEDVVENDKTVENNENIDENFISSTLEQAESTVQAVISSNQLQPEGGPSAVELTVQRLNAMEDALLNADAKKPATPETTLLKTIEVVSTPKIENIAVPVSKEVPIELPNKSVTTVEEHPKNAAPSFPPQNDALKYSSVLNRALARSVPPVKTTNNTTSTSTTKVNPNVTVTTKPMRPAAAPSLRRSNQPMNSTRATRISGGSATISRSNYAMQNIPARPTSKTETYSYGPPTHVATRLSTRSRTMVDMNGNMNTNNVYKRNPESRTINQNNQRGALPPRLPNSSINSRKSSREDIGSSSSTLKASNEAMLSRNDLGYNSTTQEERHSEPKQLPSEVNDGWLTVKNRRRSSMHWSNRFNQPTGYASLPTLSLQNEEEQNSRQSHKHRTKPLKILPSNQSNNSSTTKDNPISNSTTTTVSKSQRKQPASVTVPPQKPKSGENSLKTVSRPEIKNAKAKVNSLPTQRKNANKPPGVPNSNEKTAPNPSRKSANEPNRTARATIKRQKSDITGLKMTSLHEEYMRSEQQSYRCKNQTVSALALATVNNGSRESSMGASSTETIIEGSNSTFATSNGDNVNIAGAGGDGNEQHKIDIKIQTNRDFSKTIGDLYESIAAMSNILCNGENGDTIKRIGPLPCCEEDDEADVTLTNEVFDEHQRLLVEEQESLERQIRELESTEIDVDTETDETDCEVALDQDDVDDDVDIEKLDLHTNNLSDRSSVVFVSINEENSNGESAEGDMNQMSLEMRYHALLSEMSWGEREEALATLQAYVARHPGRAQELHQKLSSPSRRRSLHETLKKYQAKQARAQEKRELLQKEKAIKIQQLLARVEDVKAAKMQIIEDRRQKMEGRLQRAAENREQYLRQIIEKAHDEEKKLKEINFIKNIEAQNKRLELIESSKDAEGRLQDLEQERQKRLEEKAAKEAAVERRRQELEKERQRKLEKMYETRLEKEQRIGKMQEQKERERQALAREKARDREERLQALQAQKQQTTEELQRKILQKQQESARRHEENMEHIRQRALELTIPSRNQDENTCVNGDLASGTDGEHSSSISDAGTREHTRAFKKKIKKLKQRMSQCAIDYLSKEQQPLPAHMKRDSQVPKYINLIAKGGGSQGLERSLGQLLRIIAKAQVVDFQCFLLLDGLGVVTQNVISKSMEDGSDISHKSLALAVQLYRNGCSVCPQIARHAILGNSLTCLFDALSQSLQLPEEKSPQHPVELSTELMLACTVALSPSYGKKHPPKVLERLPDLISYAVITGLIENLARRCMKIRESVESQKSVILSLLATLGLLTKFIDVCQPGPTDPTRFLGIAKSTEIFGAISMLYTSVVPMGECIPPRTVSLAAATFNLLVSMAVLDLSTFQETLTIETIALKYLDVITILLKYCGNKDTILKSSETQAMIIDLVASIGFYCANNRKHQNLLTSEQCSIIIKSLTRLPEQFQVVVYPCLVTITFQNHNARNVVAREFNIDFLDEYRKSEKGKKNHLVSILKT